MRFARFHEALERRWGDIVAALVVVAVTAIVAGAYATEPQSPGDLWDRLLLSLDADDYGANLRTGRRELERANRAERAGRDSLGTELLWSAARAFDRAGTSAPGPRAAQAANDEAARTYLRIGRSYLESGRGRLLGIGRSRADLERAERAAACAVGLAPTRLRREINEFLEAVEGALDRPLEARCPW